MSVEFTPVAGKIKDTRGRDRTIQLKIGIDKDNPANPPYVVDAKDTNKILYQWNPTNKDWESTESGSTDLPISIPRGGIKPTYNEFLVNNKQMFTENTTVVINKFSDQQKELWKESNTYQPYNAFLQRQQNQSSLTGGSNTQPTIGEDDYKLTQITADTKKTWNGETFRYPTKIQDNNQDYIKFSVYDYKVKKPSTENPLVQEKNRTLGSSIANLILPIQPSITDTNTVDWNGLGLNPIELAGYGLATAGMTGDANDFSGILGKLGKTVTQDPNVQKAITLYLKQKAIGVNGVLSRFGGAVINPNIELLFQGPQLRPFNFTFRLSPRDIDEAKQVKSIIRVFKEAMSVKTASGGLFLATPNIFKISYINGATKGEHKSLNRIKTCALQSCSVDYTPDGSYMTFNDTEHTMTSYNLTLQFQELEPVTDVDYKTEDLKDNAIIGY
jgi:hypothetical protein